MQKYNNGDMQPVSKQQIDKHAYTTIELLLETVLSILPMQSGYKDDKWGNPVSWLRVALCKGGCEEKTREDGVKWPPACKLSVARVRLRRKELVVSCQLTRVPHGRL
jgi:hypothetical protein